MKRSGERMANRRGKKINTAVVVDEVVDDGGGGGGRKVASEVFYLPRGGFWGGKKEGGKEGTGRGRGACKAIPPLSRSRSAQPRQGKGRYLHTTPTPTHFSGKKKWERKTDRRREDNERPAAPADRPPKLD